MLRATSLRNLPAVPVARLATGLAQGLVLCLLYSAAEAEWWPATHGLVFAPLLLVDRLKTIEQGAQAADIRQRALAARELKNRWQPQRVALTPQELAANLAVYPAGRNLPESFLNQSWTGVASELPTCLLATHRTPKCEAIVADIDGDGIDEVIILEPWRAVVMAETGQGAWRVAGQLDGGITCAAVRTALRAGAFEAIAPRWRDLQVEGLHLRFVATPETARCP